MTETTRTAPAAPQGARRRLAADGSLLTPRHHFREISDAGPSGTRAVGNAVLVGL